MKTIIHMDMDTFFVSCERLLDPSLVAKPVLVGGTSSRGVVSACSYETRRFGVHSGMPMRMARQLCPEAVVIRGNGGMYGKYSAMVTDIIREESPLYEKASIDEFYIDMTGMDRFFGAYNWAKNLRNRIIKETNLPISLGMSTSKTVAKICTGEAKPNGHIQINSGDEKPFLAPLSVKKIPMVGDKTYSLLRSLGVEKIRTIQEMPMELMQKIMGKNGVAIWKKANGIDNSNIIPHREKKSISSSLTFGKDSTDIKRLKEILMAMTEKLCYHLRSGNKLTSSVTVTIRYSDFTTTSRQMKTSSTANDAVLMSVVMGLFDKLYKRRVLVRLVGVKFSKLVKGAYQIDLFEDSEEMMNLYQAMDNIRNRYGHNAIRRAATMDTTGIGQFNSFDGEPNFVPAHRSK